MENDGRPKSQESQKRKKTLTGMGLQLGRYSLLTKLGQGGVGTVYKAYDTKLERVVALKTLSLGEVPEKTLQRFSREAKCTAKLSHPNIVGLYDFELIQNNYCIIMEFIEGQSLEKLLEKQKVDVATCCRIILEILSAIQYAHQQGIIHRDIKPSNILINKENKAFLTDFGLAKVLTETIKISQTGALLGTPTYMSPEQAGANPGNTVDTRSDIYSVGSVFYEMLTGKRVVEGDTVYNVLFNIMGEKIKPPREVNPQIPIELDKICMKALAKQKNDRYQSATEMAAAIRKYLGKEEGEVFLEGGGRKKRVWNNKLLTWAATILVMASVGFLAVWYLEKGDSWLYVIDKLYQPTEKFQEMMAQLDQKYQPGFSEDQRDALRMAKESYQRQDYPKTRHYLRGLSQLLKPQEKAQRYLAELTHCSYLVELATFTQQKAWEDAYAFVSEVGKKTEYAKLTEKMESYIQSEREKVFHGYYQQAKQLYKAQEWSKCAEIILKGFEYHPDHPVLKEWGKTVGAKITPPLPERWREGKWDALWNAQEEWLDFTGKVWEAMTPDEQFVYARAYQHWYAKRWCLPVELEIWSGRAHFIMMLIPPGKFWMGSLRELERDNNENRQTITITKPFRIGKYEVTQSQWEQLTGKNPAQFKTSGRHGPIETVSWNDGQSFCQKAGMRLPTEAEWEYAARGGLLTPFNLGTTITTDQVNYNGHYPPPGVNLGENRQKTLPAGSLSFPNAWGCYDFHGNVREWCNDWYGESLDEAHHGGPTTGTERVYRGGSFQSAASKCRNAYRRGLKPDAAQEDMGLRVCVSIR